MAGKRLHICIVTGDFPALTETFITNKVLELRKRGHTITVIKNNNSGTNKSHLALVKQAGIEILPVPLLSSVIDIVKSPGFVIKSFSSSKKQFKATYKSLIQLALLKKHSFDIVHFEFSGLAVSYLPTIEKLKSKTVVSCRGSAEKVKPLSDRKRKENLQHLFSIVDKIHCVSEDMAASIKSYGATQEKIFVNRPSVDADYFKRTSLYNEKDVISILTIGRFTFQKGYLLGLMAVKELKKQGLNFKWNIVGNGPQHEELLYHIHALSLGAYVELCGSKNRDEILTLYETTDVFFLPSVYEGIANVCLEAMAMELPVVSTKSGGMEEVIIHEQNGLLCEVYNPTDMAEKLQQVSFDFALRKQLGVNARQTVVNNFTLQKQADFFEEQYYSLTND